MGYTLTMRKIVFLLIPVSFLFADYAPVLSDSGKKRVIDNIALIDKNLSTIKGNIVNCKKNASVIEAEMKELAVLEQEHLQLKKKYEAQIAETQKEIDKNDTAIKELETFQKNIAKNSHGSEAAQQEDVTRSQKDKMDRERWKNEANAKIEKINDLIRTVNVNLSSIEGKRTPLKEQLGQWIMKEKEFQKAFSDLTLKKEESARLLKSQN